MNKLWHDDVRPPPSADWSWARTNEEARTLLYNQKVIAEEGGEAVTECSLDHDLGAALSDGIYAKGSSKETGMQLVEWMIEHDLVPQKVIIHSWNGPGARKMAQALYAAGHNVTLAPYQVDLYIEYDPD
jgi:hypothetical protein